MRPLRGGRGRGAAADVAFELGSRVRHEEWGDGAVQRYDGDTMVGLFDDVGYKTLGVELVLDNELLAPAG